MLKQQAVCARVRVGLEVVVVVWVWGRVAVEIALRCVCHVRVCDVWRQRVAGVGRGARVPKDILVCPLPLCPTPLPLIMTLCYWHRLSQEC